MVSENSIYKHDPEEIFDGQYIQAAKAIRHGDQSTLLALLKGGPPETLPINPNHVGGQGMTLLLWSASHDNNKAVETLLDYGADPNQKIINIKGDTIQLLAIAAKGKSDALFDILLRYKANPDSRDRDEPAIFSAIYADRFDRMQRLLDAGGDINITNSAGTPAIVVLARLRKYEYVLELINRGAKITDAAADDLTYFIVELPLAPTVPAFESQLKVKQLLVKHGYSFPDKSY